MTDPGDPPTDGKRCPCGYPLRCVSVVPPWDVWVCDLCDNAHAPDPHVGADFVTKEDFEGEEDTTEDLIEKAMRSWIFP